MRSTLYTAILLSLALTAATQPPEVSELESRGAAVGTINIAVENVFDPSNPEEDRLLYRFANRLHMRTRPSVVQSTLLFEPGTTFEARLLEESARILRSRGFIADASIVPSNYDAVQNTVDVDVHIRDAWTLKPELKLSRSGGENEYGFGFAEDNMLGRGKSLTIAYSSDVDRTERFFAYSDPNVRGERMRLDVVAADTSDGKRFATSAGRAFFALDTRWSLTGATLDEQRVDSLYDRGEVVDRFRHDTRSLTIQGGWSPGLINGRARRWLTGISFEEDEFQPALNHPDPVLLPGNRKLVYPWFGVQVIGDDYREMTELNDMGRTEDVSLGLNLVMRLGFASNDLGSDRDATIFSAAASRGWEPGGPGQLLVFNAGASARKEHSGIQNAILSATARYYHRNLGRHLFSARLSATLSDRLDLENQILIGGDNDLRGYPLRYQSGKRSAVLSIEQRFFTDWYPFRLVRVGYAVFFDAGRVWGDDPRGTPSLGTLYDVGVGLRLTSPRSSRGSVVHIDLAFPLNGDPSIDDVQLIVEKKASF